MTGWPRGGLKKACMANDDTPRPPTGVMFFMRCQQIIVMLLAFAHNSAVFRSLFGVCYSYATLPGLWQL